MTTDINVIRIDPDGLLIFYIGGDLLRLANTKFNNDCEVVTCRDWDGHMLVGVVHGSGLFRQLPVNRKAWALYGHSPIVGPMFVSLDQPYPPLPDSLLLALINPAWPPAETARQIDAYIAAKESSDGH